MEQPSEFERITNMNMVVLNTLTLALISTMYRNWGAPREAMPDILRKTREKTVATMRKDPIATDDAIAFVQRQFDTIIDSLVDAT